MAIPRDHTSNVSRPLPGAGQPAAACCRLPESISRPSRRPVVDERARTGYPSSTTQELPGTVVVPGGTPGPGVIDGHRLPRPDRACHPDPPPGRKIRGAIESPILTEMP